MSVTQHIKLTHRKENEKFEAGFEDKKVHAKYFQIMTKHPSKIVILDLDMENRKSDLPQQRIL